MYQPCCSWCGFQGGRKAVLAHMATCPKQPPTVLDCATLKVGGRAMHDKTKCGHGVDGGGCGICNAVDRALPPYDVLVKPRAKAVADLVSVEPSECDGDYFLTVDIDPADPYGSFKKLPAGLEYEGRLYGKSAYNSDRNKAYYKAGLPLARRVK